MAEFSASELREIQSLTISIGKEMDILAEKSDKRNKKLANEVDLTKKVLNTINDEQSAIDAVNKLKERALNTTKQDFGVNKEVSNELAKQQTLSQRVLENRIAQIRVIQSVKKASDDVTNSIQGSLSGIQDMIGDIPVVGGLLKNLTNGAFEKMNQVLLRGARGFRVGFERGFRNITASGGNFTQGFFGGLKRGFSTGFGSAAKLGRLLLGPQAIVAAIVAALAFGVAGFVKLANAAKAFREETGLTNSQIGDMQNTIQNVYTNTATLGASMDEIAKAAADFTNEFHGIEMPSEAVVTSMIALNKNFGIATGDAAKLNKLFQEMSGLTEAQAQHLVSSTVEMANMAGVAPSKVIKDLAENSAEISVYFRGSAEELAKAAIQAAALGSSMGDLSKQAESLLNFETSIASEMKASALFGTHINMNKARAAAYEGDMLGMNKAMIEQVSKLGDLTNIDFAKKKALQELTGKDINELQRQVELYKKFPNLKEEELAAAQALLDTGKDISDLTEADLEAKNKELMAQRQMQSSIDNVKNTFENMGNVLMTALAPLGEIFFGLIQMVGDLLMPVVKSLGNILSMALKPVMIIFKFIQAIIQPIVSAFSDIQAELQPLFDKVNEVFVKIEPAITKIGSIIGGILGTVFSVIGSIIGVIVDIVAWLIDPIVEFVTYLIDGFMSLADIITEYIVEPIQNVIGGVGDFFSGVSSFFGGGDEETEKEQLEAAGSIEDGIVQNGNIITTDPEDTLIATKTPGDLLGSLLENSPIGMLGSALGGLVGGIGGGGDTTALIDEIRGLREDLNSGKIAVYMDGKNVTTKVASIASKSTKNNYK